MTPKYLHIRFLSILITYSVLNISFSQSDRTFIELTKIETSHTDSLLLVAHTLLKSDIEAAKMYTDSAFIIAEQLNYKKGMAKAWARYATYYKNIHPDSSKYYLDKSTEMCIAEGFYFVLSSNYLRFYYHFKRESNFSKAIPYLLRSIETLSSVDTTEELMNDEYALRYTAMADVQHNLGNSSNALEYADKALLSAQKSNNPNRIGSVYMLYGKFSSSVSEKLEHFHLALKYYKRGRNPKNIGKTYSNLMACHIENHSPDDSIVAYANKAIHIKESLNDGNGLIVTKTNLATYYFNQNKIEEAKHQFTSAYLLSKQHKNYTLLIHTTQRLSDIYQFTGPKDSFYYFQHIYDSLSKYETQEQFAAAQELNKYQLEIIKLEQDTLRLNNQRIEAQNQQIKSEKNILWVTVAGISALFVLLLLYARSQRKKRRIAQQLHQQRVQDQLQKHEIEKTHTVLETQEAERKRIAQELHDSLGGNLSTIKLHLSGLEDKVDQMQTDNTEQFQRTNKLLDDTITEVRRISHNMVSGTLMKFGLAAALEDLMSNIESANRMDVELVIALYDDVDGENRLPNRIETGLYRITQELMSNILKHAEASMITVSLLQREDALILMVEDDGKGFDNQKKYEGMGLKNIRSRVAKMNGDLDIDSQPGRGTIFNITIPAAELKTETATS